MRDSDTQRPEPGEKWVMTKRPGYGEKEWNTVVTIHESEMSEGRCRISYTDHFYAEGVQSQVTDGAVIPSDILRIWEEERERVVSFRPLSWEIVESRILPNLIFGNREPTNLKEFLELLEMPPW